MITLESYNMIISGVGGQGVITLLQIIAKAAVNKGYDVKTSELHGLSQRGGSVGVHIRFGRQVCSPIIPQGKTNLVLSLEYQEALRVGNLTNKDTVFIVNEYQTPTLTDSVTISKAKSALAQVSKKTFFIKASEICEKEFKTVVVAGIFLLGYASGNKIMPLSSKDIKQAIKDIMPEKHQELNLKVIDFAESYDKE